MKPIVERLNKNEFTDITHTERTFWYYMISMLRFLPDKILNKLFGNKIVLIIHSDDKAYRLRGKEFYDDKK